MFYRFHQTNAGGLVFRNHLVDVDVWIEADNLKEAQRRMYAITEEFEDYIENHPDTTNEEDQYLYGCPCCGMRWEDVHSDYFITKREEQPILGDGEILHYK